MGGVISNKIVKKLSNKIVKKLSDRKLMLIYDVPIFLENGDFICNIKLKYKYKNIFKLSNDYNRCGGTDGNINMLSQKFKVKMSNIKQISDVNEYDGRYKVRINDTNLSFDYVIKCYIICDKIFTRDFLIKKIIDGSENS